MFLHNFDPIFSGYSGEGGGGGGSKYFVTMCVKVEIKLCKNALREGQKISNLCDVISNDSLML